MLPEEYVAEANRCLIADGSTTSYATLPGGQALLGYQSQFRLRWMACKLHLFTVVAPVAIATPEALWALTNEALDYAKQTKGRLRGLQTGVAVIPVVVSSQVTPEARAVVMATPRRDFAAFTLPAIADLTSGEVLSCTERIVIGGIFVPWLRKRIAALPVPPPA